MNLIYLYTFISILTISLVSLAGVFTLAIKRETLKKITVFLVSLSAGTLLGDSFIHLLPEAAASGTASIWLWVLIGIIAFFILEKVVLWRHCHVPTSENHPHPLGIMNIIGDSMHNFLDGIIIAGSYIIDVRLGVATTIAVLVHEVPQEIGDFGVLLHAGYSKKKALISNFLVSLTSFLGAIITFFLNDIISGIEAYIAAIAAGGFIYIANSDLIPELKKDDHSFPTAVKQLFFVFLGIFIMAALKLFD